MARKRDLPFLCGVRLLRRANRRGQGASGKPPASINVRQLVRKGTLAGGVTRRLRRGRWGCRPEGVVLSFDAKESTKESQRHGDSRGGPPRCALFANIGVPGTAVPGSCICSGLPVANCLRQLCPLGTRSLSAQASACGSPSGCPRARGVRCRIAPCRSLCSPPTLPAGRFGLRPRPHWGHASLRDSSLPSPAGKKPYIAHF